VLKRSLDILLAGLCLVLALPLIAIAAFIIKLDSEGPVIFRQVRMGRNFTCFQLFKLRTMKLTSDGPAFTLGADSRITPSGRWLRWLKMDELPQMWNVLRGDMSLVGPRPVVPELTEEFKLAYARLLENRPGLTDPATLKYCREAEMLACVADPLEYFKTVVTPDKLRISRAYQQRANILSDVGVLGATAWALFQSSLRPGLSETAAARLPRTPAPMFPEVVRRREMQPAMERAWIAAPVELTVAEQSHRAFSQVAPSRFAYRHFRDEHRP